MAILLSNTVWEGTSQDMEETIGEDGQFFKQLDTGESYIHRDGEWQYINLGLSYVKATKSGTITTGDDGVANVVFETPLIDLSYSIALTIQNNESKSPIASYFNRSVDGFGIRTRKATNGKLIGGVEVSWLITRDYNP